MQGWLTGDSVMIESPDISVLDTRGGNLRAFMPPPIFNSTLAWRY
jgi:hypothetical protein